MASIDDVERLVGLDHGLTVFSTVGADGNIQSSVVNGGVLVHPVSGSRILGIVANGGSRKLDNLRARPRASAVLRAGWEWAAVEGPVDLIGPDDSASGFDASGVPGLLRDVFVAAGGTHDDWDTYDRVMAEERRTAVLIRPDRIYSNPGAG